MLNALKTRRVLRGAVQRYGTWGVGAGICIACKTILYDVSSMSIQRLRAFNTGTNVYLSGSITPVNAMEDLHVDFAL